ncbi:MAG: adenylosuccinate synthase [Coprothermobacterota bacterium]|nr:adenylosuccinate synthase [Coprothermobacterota bacterium]
MSVTVLVGLGWGDEGKGRVIDYLAPSHQIVVRYNGGANAGHTVIANGVTFRFHLLPSGMLYADKTCVVAHGVVIDTVSLREEYELVRRTGPALAKLLISDRCHLVLPYHRLLDQLEEELRGQEKIGTTGRGIGPVYADKVARKGIRVCDLFRPDHLHELLTQTVEEKNRLIERVYGGQPLQLEPLYQQLLADAEFMRPFVTDTMTFLEKALTEGQNLLMEGAQGTLLDHEIGTYPFVTSTSPPAGMVSLGSGVGPRRISKIIGVAKAYATRVGAGPFPTELNDTLGIAIRERGKEYGTTTGRPRRCGWFDLPLMRMATFANSPDEIVLTKLDVLSGFPELHVCTGYELDGQMVRGIPALAEDLERLTPLYQTLSGWNEELGSAHTWSDLPSTAKAYVSYLEEQLQVPIRVISVGPAREQIVVR